MEVRWRGTSCVCGARQSGKDGTHLVFRPCRLCSPTQPQSQPRPHAKLQPSPPRRNWQGTFFPKISIEARCSAAEMGAATIMPGKQVAIDINMIREHAHAQGRLPRVACDAVRCRTLPSVAVHRRPPPAARALPRSKRSETSGCRRFVRQAQSCQSAPTRRASTRPTGATSRASSPTVPIRSSRYALPPCSVHCAGRGAVQVVEPWCRREPVRGRATVGRCRCETV